MYIFLLILLLAFTVAAAFSQDYYVEAAALDEEDWYEEDYFQHWNEDFFETDYAYESDLEEILWNPHDGRGYSHVLKIGTNRDAVIRSNDICCVRCERACSRSKSKSSRTKKVTTHRRGYGNKANQKGKLEREYINSLKKAVN